MELKSSRWRAVKLALIAGSFLAPSSTAALYGPASEWSISAMLAIMAGVVAVIYFALPQRVVARIDGPSIWIGGKSAPLADLATIQTQVRRINFVPVSRTLIFTFTARDTDSWMARATGARRLHLAVGNVAGGRAAADQFAAQALAARYAPQSAIAPQHDPVPAPGSAAEPRADGFDADAIIARYLAAKRDAPVPAAMATPGRRGFGRKGL
jgi:hypothetical protein